MDEVDVDNAEDLIELEARLYAQIHHESSAEVVCDGKKETPQGITEKQVILTPEITTVRTVTATSVVNKTLGNKDGRYWSHASREELAQQDKHDKMQNTQKEKSGECLQTTVDGTRKEIFSKDVPANEATFNKTSGESISTESSAASTSEAPNPTSNNSTEKSKAPENLITFQTPNTQSKINPIEKPLLNSIARNKLPKQKKKDKQLQNMNTKNNKDLRVNPAAKNKRNERHRMEAPIPPNISKDGPFAKQVQKLNKAMHIEAKKRKSKDVKAKQKGQLVETISLESTESENDDVIVVPVPPPPTYTIDDSDEDKNSSLAFEIEPTTSFAKRQKQQLAQQQQQNASRCTSPSSVLSSDDFIGQRDRHRLLQDSGMADDEDLLMLTADVDSLMELPKSKDREKTLSSEPNDVHLEEEVSFSDVVRTEFVTPNVRSNDYRVEQPQFRALDVYESESDITDSVYSKGNQKSRETIIRTVGSKSSSDDNDDDGILNAEEVRAKIKRLRKRRASGSNRESDACNDGQPSSDSDADDPVNITRVPFIARGVAVEHLKTKSRHDAKASRAKLGVSTVDPTSDNEFIATLNTLAQGVNNEEVIGEDENSDSENEAPSARAIAEKVLAAKTIRQHYTSAGIVTERSASESEPVAHPPNTLHADISSVTEDSAVPDDVLTDLDKVFETIDKLDAKACTVLEVSDDDSGTDVEIADELENSQRLPAPISQLEPIPQMLSEECSVDSRTIERKAIQKMGKQLVDPVYHIVYSEENEFAGGLGWNDEMRRFYNSSWKGENFNLRQVWSQMNANKNLWKIYTEDRFPKSRRFMNLKCHNCCEFGHTRAKCTRPKKPLICYMCGDIGHYEPRCPNTVCLRCGNKTQVFTKSCNACTFQNRLICPVCKVRGHTLNLCPDKWRRYHSTTQPNAYPNARVEYNKRKWCCICAGRGHLSENCRSAVRFLEYPIFVSEIKSHQKSYNDHALRSLETGIGFNLLYQPKEDVSFELAENTTAKNYYGRFLKAVGLSYMLKRKRKPKALTSNVGSLGKSNKKSHQQYVPNPYSKAGQQARTEAKEPEQVQEISESGNVISDSEMQEAEVEEVGTIINIEENEVGQAAVETQDPPASTFKSPVAAASVQLEKSRESEAVALDSDSNYSFSEHFEVSSLSNASPTTPRRKRREMGPLPDFIPLSDNANQADENNDDVDLQAGISNRFVTAETDEDADSMSKSPLPSLPCEAKIYLTHFHSKYLLSPMGQAFLLDKSKETNVKARLDWTSVGHVLIIFGLQHCQNNFHRELLLKYRELSDEMNQKRSTDSQKVPRRTQVLIKFLRENINLLMTNLGNVNELLKRLQYLDKNQQSKNNWKNSEKTRRALNMILLGQAGLRDGNHYLDKLLLSLKKLINDYKGEENTPNELRNEIDENWKMIFTSYRHDNYPELVQHYNKMLNKNRIPKLNIDPILLGGRMIDTHLTNEQKIRMESTDNQKDSTEMGNIDQIPTKDMRTKPLNIVPNPFNPKVTKSSQRKRKSSTPPPPPPSMKAAKFVSPNTMEPPTQSNLSDNFVPPTNSLKVNKNNNLSMSPLKKSNNKPASQPPIANPQQKSTVTTNLTQSWENTCNKLLKEIGEDNTAEQPLRDCKAPSTFWSRESIKFLNECINKITETKDTGIIEKLTRVLEKSKSGQLSYNDYRAVIKIHNAIIGK